MHTYPSLRVYIQTLGNTIEPFELPVLCLPEDPNLDDVRKLLQHSPLGDIEKDIFFPSWTKSLHVLLLQPSETPTPPSWDQIESRKLTIETAEALRDILSKEEASPGTVCIILQQCRSKRYSRKKEPSPAPNLSSISISPMTSPDASPPVSPRVGGKEKEKIPFQPRLDDLFVHPGVAAAMHTPREAFHPIPYEKIYYDHQQYVPISIITPPSLYPQCYTIPVGFGTPSVAPYGYLHGPALVPHLIPNYYPYGAM